MVAGVGIEHDALVKSVEKYFIPTVPNVSYEKAASDVPSPITTVSEYTGGYYKASIVLCMVYILCCISVHVIICRI